MSGDNSARSAFSGQLENTVLAFRVGGLRPLSGLASFCITPRMKSPNSSLAKDERPQRTELGRGHIDYKPILLAAAKAAIHDYYVEQKPPFLDLSAIAAVKVDYQYLRAL